MTLSFDEPRLADAVEALVTPLVDELSFGAIRPNVNGTVEYCRTTEAAIGSLCDTPENWSASCP